MTFVLLTSNNTIGSTPIFPEFAMLFCRTCLRSIDNDAYFYIDTFDNDQVVNTVPKDVIQLCIPEVDLYVSEQPGICGDCLNQFEQFYSFKNRCLATEQKIVNYVEKHRLDTQQHKVELSCIALDIVDPESVVGNLNQEPEEVRQFDINDEVVLISINKKRPEKTNIKEDNDDEVLLLSCNECSFVTMERSKLLSHKCLALSTDKNVCPHCNYRVTTRQGLTYHLKTKHANDYLHCQSCKFKTNDPLALRKHQKQHLNPGNQSVAMVSSVIGCPLCDFTCMSESILKKHRISKHGQPIQYCQKCPYSTKDKSNFRKHLFIHSDKPKKCTKCSYQCVSPYQLSRHMRTAH